MSRVRGVGVAAARLRHLARYTFLFCRVRLRKCTRGWPLSPVRRATLAQHLTPPNPLSTGITSISTLTVLSFERYMMISRPFGVGGLSRRGAVGLIAAAWLYSLALTAPPLLGWGEYTNEAANIR